MTNGNGMREPWHLDKRIPIALILVIILQTVGAFFWAGAASMRLSNVEKIAEKNSQLGERLTRVEEKTNYIAKGVERIEEKLDKGKDE